MKKIFNLIFVIIVGLTLVSCNGGTTANNDEVKVYFYEYRNAYKKEELRPDILRQQTYKKGELIEEPEEPTRDGYIFGGWYKELTLREEWNFAEDIIDRNLILYAKWDPAIYKVSLELNGGVFPPNTNFNGEYDEDGIPYYMFTSGVAQGLHNPVRTGFEFLGWFTREEYRPGDRPITSVDRNISSDVTYYAHWKALRITIRFDVNLEAEPKPVPEPATVPIRVYDYGQTIDFPVLEDTSGIYEFVGWNTRRDGSGAMLVNGEPLEQQQTTRVYAQWILK